LPYFYNGEVAMARRDFTFKITDKVQIHLDTKRNAVILFETHDGKSVQLEADYKTINKIHDQIQKLEEGV
jgi:hypothetical protein